MANKVFTNGREIACKAGSGKSICAFPDVCMTPPQTPATPPGVPIPYPNTGMAGDTTSGSKKVKVSNKEVMLKNKSYFKKSTGDEAGAAPMKGVVTHTNRGKVYFNMWSMNVKIEGENVVRHLDLTTHNHGSAPGNSPPWAYTDEAAMESIEECKEEVKNAKEKCDGLETREEQCDNEECNSAKKCLLVTKQQGDRKSESTKVGCCDGEQPHHMIEDHWVKDNPNFPKYNHGAAPTVCCTGGRCDGEHGLMHAIQGVYEDSFLPVKGKRPAGLNYKAGKMWNYTNGKKATIRAHQLTFPKSACSSACLEAQLDRYYGKDTEPSRELNQTESRQAIGEPREDAEVLVDLVFGGHLLN